MKRKSWKVWVGLIGGVVMVTVGALLSAEAADVIPFRVYEWPGLIIGLVIAIVGWTHISENWKAL